MAHPPDALGDARMSVFTGPPLRLRAMLASPIIASSEAEARAFRARFRSGCMGRLTAIDQSALGRDFDNKWKGQGGSRLVGA
jgi:hypothetical protein